MAEKIVNLRVDQDLWKRAKKAAIDQGVPLKEWIAGAIKEKLESVE